jgi:chemotaxis protein CheD
MTAVHQANSAECTPAGGADNAPSVYLFPGQIFTSAEPALVTTILGSCVAVCLWDPEISVGGINHFLLPANPMRGGADARYGNSAMERLLEAVVERGAHVGRLVAKIVGGARVIDGFSGARQSIGEQNVVVAREFLKRLEINVSGDQTGGRQGRKLLFHTGNGSAYVKEI